MAMCAKTIGKRKFLKLSSQKQHQILASLAYLALLEKKNHRDFQHHYEKLQSWGQLDKYSPPAWLSEKEALHEYISFHNSFCTKPVKPETNEFSEELPTTLSWNATFDIEIVIDQVRSPYNTGSIIRAIDNFGFKRLIHSTSWLNINNSKLCKAARGCQKWIPIEFKTDLIDYLENATVPIIGIENSPNSISVMEWSPPSKCILIVGNETYGIAQTILQRCHETVNIPMFGYKNSMNVHHALSIVAHKIIEIHDIF